MINPTHLVKQKLLKWLREMAEHQEFGAQNLNPIRREAYTNIIINEIESGKFDSLNETSKVSEVNV